MSIYCNHESLIFELCLNWITFPTLNDGLSFSCGLPCNRLNFFEPQTQSTSAIQSCGCCKWPTSLSDSVIFSPCHSHVIFSPCHFQSLAHLLQEPDRRCRQWTGSRGCCWSDLGNAAMAKNQPTEIWLTFDWHWLALTDMTACWLTGKYQLKQKSSSNLFFWLSCSCQITRPLRWHHSHDGFVLFFFPFCFFFLFCPFCLFCHISFPSCFPSFLLVSGNLPLQLRHIVSLVAVLPLHLSALESVHLEVDQELDKIHRQANQIHLSQPRDIDRFAWRWH